MNLKPKSPKINKNLLKLSIAKKQANDYGLIATSYHESAHAIMGLANLIMIQNVVVVDSQEGDTNYFIHHADDANDDNLKKIIIMSELKTIYAGLVGEKMYYKDICGSWRFPMHLKKGSSFDTEIAAKIIRKYKLAEPGKQTFKLKQEIRKEVENFLIDHWESVKAVAHGLYKKKKLSFIELKNILTRVPEDKIFWKDIFKTIKIVYDEDNDLSTKVVRNLISTKSNR